MKVIYEVSFHLSSGECVSAERFPTKEAALSFFMECKGDEEAGGILECNEFMEDEDGDLIDDDDCEVPFDCFAFKNYSTKEEFIRGA